MDREAGMVNRELELLRASLAVCRFVLVERDLPNLLQGICDRLVQAGAHHSAWIVLMDEEMGGVITAEAGLGERFAALRDQLQRQILPRCGELALAGEERVILCRGEACGDGGIFEKGNCGLVLATAVRCRPGLRGFLVVEPRVESEPEAFEKELVADLAESIAHALRQLFLAEEARHREDELRRVEERFELALHASQAGLWDWNIKTGEMYTSPDRKEFLDYRNGNGGEISGLGRQIHPEDRPRVLQVLNDHLAGRTEEYRIEYRIREEDGSWSWYLDRGRVVERDERNMPVRMTGTHQNITRQKQQAEALETVRQQLHEAVDHERTFLQTVIDGATDPIMAIDLDYRILLMNATACRLMGVDPENREIQGSICYRLFHDRATPCDDPRYPCPVREVEKRGQRVSLVHNPYHGNGINNTFEIEVSPLRNRDGELYGIIEVARDITDRLRIEQELRESQSRLYRLAHHDPLTGLPNRLLFRDRLERAIAKARRTGTRVAILFLDLDRFKSINDTLGHDVGDELLIEVSRRLQDQCRQSDTVARLGGDEFVFILDDISGQPGAAVVARKIMHSLARPMRLKGHEITVSTSIGIAIFPDDCNDIDGVIRCADTALYQAKDKGRGTYSFYSRDMEFKGSRISLEKKQLHAALAQRQFVVRYQPQYEASSERLVGLEALLRWNHPREGLLAPDRFLPLAEESGMIVDIGRWVLEEVCRQVVKWQQQGLAVVPVAVNISARQLADRDFASLISSCITESGLSPEFLEIELSEATMMQDAERNLAELERIARLGIRLSVDDFGTGRFSLAVLQKMPLDRLKIDTSFTTRIIADRNMAMLVDVIIVLAHSLGLKVLAEGVENRQQLEFLRRHQCDQVQGYYLARPLDADKTAALLQPRK
ncbi:putative bifunctional diguanylate cyclase/phosphodiesterase [Thermodesulfobacteriota bacterium B35]